MQPIHVLRQPPGAVLVPGAVQPVGYQQHHRPLPEHAARPEVVENGQGLADPRAPGPIGHAMGDHLERHLGVAMAELARIAAPGARVIVTDFHPDALRRGWKRTFKSGADTIEMESEPYSISELAHDDLALDEFHEFPFGEQERHFFEAAGKGAWFDEMRDQPAILVASYRRRG